MYTLWHITTEAHQACMKHCRFGRPARHLAYGSMLKLVPSNLFYHHMEGWGAGVSGRTGRCLVVPHTRTRPRSYIGVCHQNSAHRGGKALLCHDGFAPLEADVHLGLLFLRVHLDVVAVEEVDARRRE